MSSITKTSCCDSLCDSFIAKFPKASKASGNVAKVAALFTVAVFMLASIFSGTMIANNPNLLFLSEYSVTQVVYFSGNMGMAALGIITWCISSCINQRVKEKVTLENRLDNL